MKKAIKINISGVIFHIDEDAYEILKSYLKSVERFFTGKEGKEIIDDIESRIAELFQTRTQTHNKVITIEHVNEIIEIMGHPGDFIESVSGAEEESGATGEDKRITIRRSKRLYRDPENSVLGGVCGGLGSYFSIDPVLIRVLFVILLIAGYGVWGLVYIVLWIAIPRAVTISQRLEMRGERITMANIEKNVKAEYEGVRANFRNLEKTEGYKRTTSAVEEIFRVLGRIILVVLKIAAVLAGVVLVIIGLVLLMSFLGVFIFGSSFTFGWFHGDIIPFNQFLTSFIEPVSLIIFMSALFVAIFIPLLAIIYGGIKLVFRLRTRDSGIGLVSLIIWIISLTVLFTVGIIEVRKYAFRGTSQESVIISSIPGQTLYLELNEKVRRASLEDITWFDFRGVYLDRQNDIIYTRPSLSIRYGRVDAPELFVERSARGYSPMRAEINAEKIGYNWEQNDSILIFDNLFALEPEMSWNFPGIHLRLLLPDDFTVHIGDRMDRIITSARTPERMSISSMTGKKWRMTGHGLEPVVNRSP
jgi:phage shock protein PspC (stress-responsive transcriptional regulator)